MSYPKFILTDAGKLKLGRVNLHRDLIGRGEHCLGGGFYEFDYVNSRLMLSGRSFDYGRPQWTQVDALRLDKAYEGLTLMYSSNGDPDDAYLLSDILPIIYS